VDAPEGRYYVSLSKERNDMVYVPSVTTIVRHTTKMPFHLLQWYAKHGFEKAEEIKTQSAEYGTLMHITIANYLMQRKLNLSAIPTVIEQYKLEKRITYDTSDWNTHLRQDLLAFHQFALDYAIEPIAIEIPLVSKHGYGGAIDLTCMATFKQKGFWGEVYKSGENKGLPKETFQHVTETVMVDFKSGRHGFYEEHELQLDGFYRPLWNENFSEHPIKRTFNWSPKDWTSSPSYNFTEQTGKSSQDEALLHLRKFQMRYQRAPFQFMEMDGFLKMGEELDERIVQRTSILDVIRREWEREGIMSPRENDAPPAANAPRHENPLEDEYETTSLFTDNN
jgi:hypothetical protein